MGSLYVRPECFFNLKKPAKANLPITYKELFKTTDKFKMSNGETFQAGTPNRQLKNLVLMMKHRKRGPYSPLISSSVKLFRLYRYILLLVPRKKILYAT
jgi:hypothetical protein